LASSQAQVRLTPPTGHYVPWYMKPSPPILKGDFYLPMGFRKP
jgi:hypothetical protein